MSVERRAKARGYQSDLFDEALLKALRHGAPGDGGTGTGACVERQALSALAQQRALTQDLMERVAASADPNHAYKRVKANKGAPGVDGMTVDDLRPWLAGDKRLLRIVPRFLEAGDDARGRFVCGGMRARARSGPLSPLLANLLPDDLDKMLEARGHRFCRYADDCNIYLRSEKAGERVMAKVAEFLRSRLRLQVNRRKSAVAPAGERKFLGHRPLRGGRCGAGAWASRPRA